MNAANLVEDPADRAPENEVSATSATQRRLKSSTTAKTRNLRPLSVTSLTKSMLQRSFGLVGVGSTVRGAATILFRRFVLTERPSRR
jgi:hypothetical protein